MTCRVPRFMVSNVREGHLDIGFKRRQRGGLMTSTLKATLLLAIISLTASLAQAQNASLTHIFPQVVDGVGSDGTIYTSRFLIASSSLSSPATCEVSLFGT